MINKIQNKSKASVAKEIAKKYGLSDLEKEFNSFIEFNEQYKAHILLIGGYSAGKSALLNKYIGKTVLVEDQGPQTNVATELHYSENERIVATFMDGTKSEVMSPDDVDVNTVRNIEYYLDSENIKTQCDYIIVDTPGFDSGIEQHNKALMQYVDYGTAFILVVDCEKGTVSESALNFVNEVSHYSNDIAVIINKCDKKVPEDAEAVKEHIEDLLLASCGKSFNVICTSIYDDDVSEKIAKLISLFSPQYLYEKNVTERLVSLIDTLVNSLGIIKEKRNCDTSEIDEEIANRERAKQRLLEQIETQKKRLGTKLHNEIKEKIVGKIQSQLMVSAPALAQAYQGGVELFQQKIIEIIRPIMVTEMEEYSTIACEDFISHLNYNSLNIVDKSEEIADVVNSVYSKLIALNENQSLVVPRLEQDDINSDKIDESIVAYKTITSLLAISTEFVWPPLELVIVFLPDIIKFLNTLTGTTKEQQLIDAIQKQIIPQIVSKIRNELDQSLSDVEEVMIENICLNIEEIIDIESEALEVAKGKKEEYQMEFESFINQIEEDINLLRK